MLFKLVTSKEIDSGEKLRGKKLGVASLGGSTYLATVRALQHFGMKANDVTILAIGSGPNRLTAVQTGSIQGAVFLPPETLIAKKLGLNFLLDLGSLGVEFQNAVIAAGKNAAEKKPETARRFIKAMVEGIHSIGPIEISAYEFCENISRPAIKKSWKRLTISTVIKFPPNLTRRLKGCRQY
jgi:ABC-type nitrate/sulfonate/bicarbonate transport system substrate-binding protein